MESEDDRFGEELSIRMAGTEVGTGPVPLAEIRREGRRRSRGRRVVQVGAAAVAVMGCASLALLWNGDRGPVASAPPLSGATAPPTASVRPAVPTNPAPGPPSVIPTEFICPGATGAAVPTVQPGPSGLADDPQLDQAARVAENLGGGSYADHYTGVCTDQSAHTLYVYRVPGSGFDAAVRAQVHGPTLVFRDARFTHRELVAQMLRVSDDPYWQSKPFEIVSVAPRADGSGLSIAALHPDQVREELMDRYKPYVAEVVQGRSATLQ